MRLPMIFLGLGLLFVAACSSVDGEVASGEGGSSSVTSTSESDDVVVSDVVPDDAAPSSSVGSEDTGSEDETASSLGRNDDAAGDQRNMSDDTLVGQGGGEPGADITHTEYFAGDTGAACFDVDVAGDGQSAAAEAPNYLITTEAVGPDGSEWQAFVEYRFGEQGTASVWLGPKESGRPKVDEAAIILEWLDADTLQVCVDGAGETLAVGTYTIKLDFFGTDGNFFDSAEGSVG